MKITKKRNDKYTIELNDGTKFETYSEVILKNNLLYKKELDNKLLSKISKENEYYDSYDKVLKFVLKKVRSIKETNEYIIKQNLIYGEKIIKDLKERKLLNDEMFAKSFVNDRFYLSKDGPYKIYNELIKYDIDETIIKKCLDKITEEEIKEKITKYIAKKISNNSKYSNRILKEKVLNELYNLGYEKDLILRIFDNYKIDDTNIVKKEYDKLYNKYSKKYNDKELYYKIKQAMYQKGLNIDKIKESD